jgi:hypothetical protein
MFELTHEQAVKTCRALLVPERADTLIAYWQRAYPEIEIKAVQVLVIASLIAAGSQEPSATTALSAARGLENKKVGNALLLVGLAYQSLVDSGPMTDVIRQLAAEGLQSTFSKFRQAFIQKENDTA